MKEINERQGPARAFTGRQWPGRFDHPDTRALLNLNPSLLSHDRFREKRWCYLGVISPDIILGCAVIHLGYMAGAFVFGFDRKEKTMVEHAPVFLPLGQVCFDRSPETGMTSYQGLFGRLCIAHEAGLRQKTLSARFYRPGRSLRAEIKVFEPGEGFFPMHFHMPMEAGKRAFTTKAAGLNATGRIILNGKSFDLDPETAFAVFDWTNGFYPRRTSWNWACGAGLGHDGQKIGFNFSSGVYESGLLENTVWINGHPESIDDDIVFSYDPQCPSRPWQIQSRNGAVNLLFKPEGIRQANENLGIVQSRFIQPCGAFEGAIRTSRSVLLRFSEAGGVVEEHHARW